MTIGGQSKVLIMKIDLGEVFIFTMILLFGASLFLINYLSDEYKSNYDAGYATGYTEHNHDKALEFKNETDVTVMDKVKGNFTGFYNGGYYKGYYDWKVDQYVNGEN
jgi:hypothetical protein